MRWWILGLAMVAGCAAPQERARRVPVAWVTIWPAWDDADDVASGIVDDREVPILGLWRGRGEQTSGATWTIELEVTSATRGDCAAIRYPSSACGGTWRCTYGTTRTRLEASEQIAHGKTSCIDGGEVTAWLAEDTDRMRYVWKTPGESAWGELERVQ